MSNSKTLKTCSDLIIKHYFRVGRCKKSAVKEALIDVGVYLSYQPKSNFWNRINNILSDYQLTLNP